MKKIKKFIKLQLKKDPINILVPIVSILILIVSSFSIGFKKGLLIFIIINLTYFLIIPIIRKYVIKKKKKRKPTYKKGYRSYNSNKNTKNYSKSRNAKVVKKNKKPWWKVLLLVILIGFIFMVISMILFFAYIVANAPDFDEKLLYVTDPSIVYDKDGDEIAKLGTEKRVTISYDEVPEVLIDAIIATEDSRFFEHNGVDWARFLKASAYQLMGRSEAGGASTLTMQLSKNTYTSKEAGGIAGIIRKFTDVYVAMSKIEKKYTKEQIFEFYINSQYLGRQAYGVEQVSLNYFGKSAKELNVAEAAMIAGLFQAPGRYDPYNNPDGTENRRKNVLKLMLRHDYITQDEYNTALKMTVDKIVIPKEENEYLTNDISPYQAFIDTVVEEVEEKTGNNPYTTPMLIYTTMDTGFQNYINNIMDGETYKWENDVVQAGVAVVSVNDGSIAAIGGGRNIDVIDSYNYATDINRQIGSTAKPLYDYGPAIEYNHISTYQAVVDEPIKYSNGASISNWDGKFQGLLTTRNALKGSRNIPALKTFKQVRDADKIEFVTSLGLTPQIYSCNDGFRLEKNKCIDKTDASNVVDANKADNLFEAHSIGGYNGESPLSMAAAYAAFGNGGKYTKPYSFTKLVYRETNEEYINTPKSNQAMSRETAYMVSDMLVTTASYALGKYSNINGIKYAAKTGTTNYPSDILKEKGLYYTNIVNDLWVVGYNTEYAIGVWYGYNKLNTEYYNKLSSMQNSRLFQAVGKKVFTDKSGFKKPSGVVSVRVEKECPEAMLPSDYTPSDLTQTELFIKGFEPSNVSPRFAKLNDISNLNVTTNEKTISLTWDGVSMPQINTRDYLKEYYSTIFENENYLNKYVSSRMDYISDEIGNIGYEVYLKNSDGSLSLLNFTTLNRFTYEAAESGSYTFVIKTAYAIFKSNRSNGKEATAVVTINTTPNGETEPDTGDNNENIVP